MWPGNTPELMRAKMLHNYLDECRKREIREMRNKNGQPSHLILIGKKLLKVLRLI
ncbi:MAG: hypothetical protein RBS38_03560 [Bacteroidales bacterium]|jgi:hypothetical protein|nr:hypothetical protein [Bacteroidales bacterium]